MKAARLFGAKDMRVVEVNDPPAPGEKEILIRVKSVGICGSDLHMYESAKIGYTDIFEPITLGHEFMGEVVAVGPNALDGEFKPLMVGQRVAVDPCTPCWECEMCEKGHPNLCPNHTFYGLYPHDGALSDCMIVNARNCFVMPDEITDEGGALLETLGVAIHASDLSKIKIGNSVAILGAGPVGLLILRLAKLQGAHPIIVTDKHDWRLDKAREWGATHTLKATDDVADEVMSLTNGRGVDIAIEAAWADKSVQQAADMLRYGGRLVLVGIPGDDKLELSHAVVRRKGATIMMVRRMKHSYPRAIDLAMMGKETIDLDDLVSHRFSLEEVPEAYRMNFNYEDGVHKAVVNI